MPEACSRRLIGVIDLLGRVAVRAVGGRRSEYRPLTSSLVTSPDPRRVAAAFYERYGIDRLYVADLDAILGGTMNRRIIAGLVSDGFQVAVDAGLRTAADADALVDLGVAAVIAGLETLPGPAVLATLVERAGADRLVFSLDLADGVPLADPAVWSEPSWQRSSPLRIAQLAAESGVDRLIILDVRAVGTDLGPTTTGLCRQVKRSLPGARIWTGGGVRNADDVQRLVHAGAEGVLVATALHDGTIEQRLDAAAG